MDRGVRARWPRAHRNPYVFVNRFGDAMEGPVAIDRLSRRCARPTPISVRCAITCYGENGQAQIYEVTSLGADNRNQSAKEGRIRAQGGAYIKDRSTGALAPVQEISKVERIE